MLRGRPSGGTSCILPGIAQGLVDSFVVYASGSEAITTLLNWHSHCRVIRDKMPAENTPTNHKNICRVTEARLSGQCVVDVERTGKGRDNREK